MLEESLMIEHVRSEDNIIDIFTKPLSKGPFEQLQGLLGLVTTSHFKRSVEIIEVKVGG
ncbi:hypothetical protein KSP40_PGU011221 [Platanthera guangdongensis]|uniref:Uncharacterized protein n=1 Tax=Platanthera guangdongensis TaxID=2320717 RepID=A0ABR2MBF5_9ASPA